MKRTDSTKARPGTVEAGASSPSSVGGAPIYLTIPVPPSLNVAFSNRPGTGGRGRMLSKIANDWIRNAKVAIHLQSPGHISGPVIVVMNVERKSSLADIDNRTKLVFDLLKKAGVIDDDRFITAHATAWSPLASREEICLAILPAERLAITFYPSDSIGAVGGWIIEDPAHTMEGV